MPLDTLVCAPPPAPLSRGIIGTQGTSSSHSQGVNAGRRLDARVGEGVQGRQWHAIWGTLDTETTPGVHLHAEKRLAFGASVGDIGQARM